MAKQIVLCALLLSVLTLAKTQRCPPRMPRWPSEFQFVRGYPRNFLDCVKITVPQRATIWTDKYFCQRYIKFSSINIKLIGMRWSHSGK